MLCTLNLTPAPKICISYAQHAKAGSRDSIGEFDWISEISLILQPGIRPGSDWRRGVAQPNPGRRMEKPLSGLIAAIVLSVAMAGCAANEPPGPNQSEVMHPPPKILADHPQMKAGPEGSELLYYQDLDAESSRYGSIIIEPIRLWCGDMTLDISPEDQFVLSQYMYQVLKEHLGQDFKIVDQPGPGVMRLQITVIDLAQAPTGMDTVSATPPPASLPNVVKELSNGAYSFTGAAESEGEVTDSVTGVRLLAWIDRRVGGGSRKIPAEWQWGDAHAAIDYWAETLTARLMQWHFRGDVAG